MGTKPQTYGKIINWREKLEETRRRSNEGIILEKVDFSNNADLNNNIS